MFYYTVSIRQGTVVADPALAGSAIELTRQVDNLPHLSLFLKGAGMTTYVIPAVYSLAVWQSLSTDFRPMTLRHYVSVVLLFGQPVDRGWYPLLNNQL